jgi:hypothetical protein
MQTVKSGLQSDERVIKLIAMEKKLRLPIPQPAGLTAR